MGNKTMRKIENLNHAKIKELIKKGSFNIKTPTGHIFMAGGILSKLEDKEQYFSIKGKWVKC